MRARASAYFPIMESQMDKKIEDERDTGIKMVVYSSMF